MPGSWEWSWEPEEPWEEDDEGWEEAESDWEDWFLDTYDGMIKYFELPSGAYYWDDLFGDWILVA